MRNSILLYGGSGMLGSRIVELLSDRFEIISPTHEQVDLTSNKQILENIKDVQPDVIIYSAGLISVDRADEDPKLAFCLNASSPLQVAKIAKKYGIPVYYISTDAVFDGKRCRFPHTEKELPNPKTVYGKSKLQGEKNILYESNMNCVVRVVMLYSRNFSKRKDFVKIVLDGLSDNKTTEAIPDQIVSPMFVDTLVNALYVLITNKATGIYHLGPTNHITNFAFAELIADKFNYPKNLIKAIKFDKFYKERKKNRSRNLWLDVSKFEKEFGANILNLIEKDLELFKQNHKSK